MLEVSKNKNTYPIQEIEELLVRVFPEDNPDSSVLGVDDNAIVAPNLVSLLTDADTTLGVAEVGGRVAGVSVAIPIGKMDPSRASESLETAYIYYTAIEPSLQGKGVVGDVMDSLIPKLKDRGYSYVERDCVIENGYADTVQRVYEGAIINSYDHTHFPEIGPERFFRIDLNRLDEPQA